MKKLFSIVLLILLATVFVACDKIQSNNDSASHNENSSISSTSSQTEYTFKDLYGYDENDIQDIQKIVISEHPGSVVPPHEITHAQNTDTEYFNDILQFIKTVKFTECTDPYTGVSSRGISIITKNRTYSFSKTSRNEYYVDKKIYVSSIECPIRYAYKDQYYSLDSYYVVDIALEAYGSKIKLESDPMQNLYYKYVTDNAVDKTSYSESVAICYDDSTKIYIVSQKNFYFNDKYCELINDGDFSQVLLATSLKTQTE